MAVSVNHPFAENMWHREAGLEPDYFATYSYTAEWTAGGRTAPLRYRPDGQDSRSAGTGAYVASSPYPIRDFKE